MGKHLVKVAVSLIGCGALIGVAFAAKGNLLQPPPAEVVRELKHETAKLPIYLQIRILPAVAFVQARSGQVSEATSTFEQAVALVDRYKEEMVSWFADLLAIAEYQQKARQVEAARATIAQALELSHAHENETDFLTHLSWVPATQARIGDMTGVEHTLARLHEVFGIYMSSVEVFAMASLVEVLIQQEKRQVAHAMLHAFASRKKDWNRHKKAMALLFAKLGDVATAKDMLEKVVKAQETSQGSSLSHALLVNTETRLQIAQGFWRAGRTVSARSMLKHTLREIETMREQIPDESFAQALEAMIWPKLVALQTKFGNLQEAQHLLAQIPREFLKEEPLLTILGIRLQTGEIEKARETARHPAIIGFESVIRTQIRYGDVEGAQRSLEALEERIASNEGLQRHRAKYHIVEYPRDYHNAVWVVAKARMRIGEYPETLDWARNQSTTDLKAYALLGVAEGLLEKREIVH